MNWVYLAVAITLGLFSFVLLFGAPYLPTLKQQQQEALDLLALKPGQILVELGSGDGRMLVAAAKLNIKSIGYELNPLLVLYSWVLSRRYKGLITIKWANFWRKPLPVCDGIYVFLLDRYMPNLHKKIVSEATGPIRLVSFAFKIPDKSYLTDRNGLYLYQYPDIEKV
ncbi:MAG: hypothetical protein M3Q14_01480 [bacterium]|nr:hypothetical protein [bacterium]